MSLLDRRTMNYNNSSARLRVKDGGTRRAEEMVYSIETDKRGVHLRLRKADSLPRRAARQVRDLAAAVMLGLSSLQIAVATTPCPTF